MGPYGLVSLYVFGVRVDSLSHTEQVLSSVRGCKQSYLDLERQVEIIAIACYIDDALIIAVSNLFNAGVLLHIVFKQVTMDSPLSQVKISCS